MSFDPYHRWLGIPPQEQPPHHYRLLALGLYEDNPEVIEAAADQRMAHLRNYQSGQYAKLSQDLLNEVAAARVCLLDPEKKAAYDEQLRARVATIHKPLAAPPAAPVVVTPTAAPPAAAKPVVAPPPKAPEANLAGFLGQTNRPAQVGSQARRRAKQSQLWAVLGVVALGIAVVLFLLVGPGGSSDPAADSNGQTGFVPGEDSKSPKPTTPSKKRPDKRDRKREQPSKDPDKPPRSILGAGAPPTAVVPFDAAKAKEHQQNWARYLNVPVEGINSIGMRLVLIPPGEFEMGSTDAERQQALEAAEAANDKSGVERIPTEVRHWVKISAPFYLAKHEVTQSQWAAVMGENPSEFKAADAPVENVSWDDVQAFLAKLNASAGQGPPSTGPATQDDPDGGSSLGLPHSVYVLPTEAQWEYACRAGTSTVYSFGDDVADLGEHAWFLDNSDRRLQPVGRRKPNAWGLCDMHGNVWEWCADWWGSDYHRRSPGTDPTGPATGSQRVLRGGNCRSTESDLRSALRNHEAPDNRIGRVGFRVALTVVPGAPGLEAVAPDEGTMAEKPAVPEEGSKRLPVPAEQERQKVAAQVAEVYELSKERTPEERKTLAEELIAAAEKPEKPTERYVMLQTAAQLLGASGEGQAMLEAVETLAAAYEVDPLAEQAAVVKSLAATANDSNEVVALLDAGDLVIDVALEQGNYGAALEVVEEVYKACAQGAGRDHRKRAFDRRKEVQAASASWQEFQAVVEKLKTNPDDPEANLAAGRYWCFGAGDWVKGLPHLAKSSNAELQKAAQAELDGPPADPEAMLALADDWWDLSLSRQGAERKALMLRAGKWYRQAKPDIDSSLLDAKIAKRLEEIDNLSRPESEAEPIPGMADGEFPTPAVADEHEGSVGRGKRTKNNTYRLDFSEPTLLATGDLRFKIQPAERHNISGRISCSLDGTSWQPVGQWTQTSCVQALEEDDGWHMVPLTGISKRLKAPALLVRFDYVSGADVLTILSVEWVERQE